MAHCHKWFEELKQNDKVDWSSIEAAFRKQWPRKKPVKKANEEYEEELHDLQLKTEDLGKKERVAEWEHYFLMPHGFLQE